MRQTPILLLTGYLGSGKTTLVNKILTNAKGIRFAVIVNDIGEVNIDADLIQKGGVVGQADDSLLALQNGCICCTLKMDLARQLCEIAATQKFDYIVIEASGVCEPEPIARTICSISKMRAEDFEAAGLDLNLMGAASSLKLDCVTTVVDALRMRDEFACAKDLLKGRIAEDDIESLVIQQVEFCNIILLNKASEIAPDQLEKVREIIRALQPQARIIDCDYGDVPLETLLETGLFDYDSVASSATWFKAVEGEEEEESGEVYEYGIGTYVYYERRPLDINKFDNFVAKHWPSGLIRAKGICYFSENTDLCYLFEQAGTQISLKNIGQWYATAPREELMELIAQDPAMAKDWDPVYGDRMQKLVFIGQHLDKEAIKDALDFCLAD